MSDPEETIESTETAEEVDRKEDEATATKSSEKEEREPEEKGFLGEIMDLVRSGSPPKEKDTNNELEKAEEVEEKKESDEEVKQEPPSDDKEQHNDDPKEEDSSKEQLTAEDKEDDMKAEEDANDKKDGEPATEESKDEDEVKSKDKGEDDIVTPYLLTDEEIISRGVAESDIEMYRKFHLKMSYSPKVWYDLIKDHTFTTEFIELSPDEINALLSMHHLPSEEIPELSEETKAIIEQLQQKIDAAISKYEEGAFIKLNTHSPRDAILDRNDHDHIQAVEDGIQNELEIEQQFVNAYLNWRSWRSMSYRENSNTKLPSEQRRGNVVRRSFRRIQKSFNRPRAQTAGTETRPKEESSPLAEEKAEGEDKTKKVENEEGTTDKKEEESKDNKEEGQETGTETEAGTETSKDKETGATGEETKGDEEASQDLVTVEATVEKTTPTTTDDIAEVDGETKDEKTEEETKKETEEPSQANEDKKENEIEELKEKGEESKAEEEVKGEGAAEVKSKRVPPPMLAKEHQFIKVKAETKGNKVLRAFIKATTAMYKVTSGEQAIQLLTTSRVIKEDLEQAKVFANISGAGATLSVQRWYADVASYPGMQFRAFVYKSQLNALSQKDDVAYIPNIARYKDTIQSKIVHFFDSTVKQSFQELDSYIVDIFVGANKIYVVDLYPFYTGTGACLYTWQQNKKLLLNGPIHFSYIHTPFKNCFTGLQPHWQQVCTNAQQKKKKLQEPSGTAGNKCVIL